MHQYRQSPLFPSTHVTDSSTTVTRYQCHAPPSRQLQFSFALEPAQGCRRQKPDEKALRPSFHSFQVLITSPTWFQSFQFLKTSPTWFSIFWRWTPPRVAFQPFTFCTFTKTLKIFFFDYFDDKRDISKDTSCIKFLSFCCLSLVSLGPKTNMSKD